MIEISNPQGQVSHRSRNLRGVLDHARRAGLWSAHAYPSACGQGLLGVTFADGAQCQVEFASYVVLCDWLRARRSWAGARSIAGGPPF